MREAGSPPASPRQHLRMMDKAATVSREADDALRALVRATPPFDRLPEDVLRKREDPVDV